MHLYLVPKRKSLADMRAVVELLKECYDASLRGTGYGMGLVYATPQPVPEEDRVVLGIVPWI